MKLRNFPSFPDGPTTDRDADPARDLESDGALPVASPTALRPGDHAEAAPHWAAEPQVPAHAAATPPSEPDPSVVLYGRCGYVPRSRLPIN